MKLITGNSNGALANSVAAYLHIPLVDCWVKRFHDNEIFVEIRENVRGEDVYLLQSTSYPINDNLMELLIITDALKRSFAGRITAVLPYFGYARQNSKSASRTPISAKLVANLIARSGIDRVSTLDLHAAQIQGFFDIPSDDLLSAPIFVRDIEEHHDMESTIIVSPDVGGVARARAIAQRLGRGLAIVDRRGSQALSAEGMDVIGDVAGCDCILIDDIVDSANTLAAATDALLKVGAARVCAYATHGVLSGGASERITKSGLQELVITDSVERTISVDLPSKIRRISVASLIGEAIGRAANEQSVSSLLT